MLAPLASPWRGPPSTTSASPCPPLEIRRTRRNKEAGSWLSIQPTFVSGMYLSKEEWRDGARMGFGLKLPNLQKKCDGCGCRFTVKHALQCKQGGLVVGRYNEIRDEAGAIAIQVLSPNRVCDKPKIVTSSPNSPGVGAPASATVHGPSSTPESPPPTHKDGNFFDRGELLVRGLYDKITEFIIDVCVTDTDQPSYRGSAPE